ncbi:UDP-N-acetylglucosamine transporter [Platysternon megacephalum]|uniref:UDP-N-acetylglucosamine transporter n=1 Tax=Platysternon megacephalum TaxID=55544 RepID=A0A4D9E2L6_9SAUR|nr:UDP-N-acetylglucosamine transporter [Platysternon megacephalum]
MYIMHLGQRCFHFMQLKIGCNLRGAPEPHLPAPCSFYHLGCIGAALGDYNSQHAVLRFDLSSLPPSTVKPRVAVDCLVESCRLFGPWTLLWPPPVLGFPSCYCNHSCLARRDVKCIAHVKVTSKRHFKN